MKHKLQIRTSSGWEDLEGQCFEWDPDKQPKDEQWARDMVNTNDIGVCEYRIVDEEGKEVTNV